MESSSVSGRRRRGRCRMAHAGAPRSAIAQKSVTVPGYPFTLGVASGDPWPDGFVIWTRLAPDPLTGGGMPIQNVIVDWQVADDEAMTKVVAKGTAVAMRELAHSVHVEVQGLEPGRWYWYQFQAAGEVSPRGRSRTSPREDETPDKLRFAFASCQHYESGYFTAYQHMANEDLDSRQYRTDHPAATGTSPPARTSTVPRPRCWGMPRSNGCTSRWVLRRPHGTC